MKMKPVFSMRHEYDSWNRMQEIVYPDGETVSYHYDRGGQLREVKSDKNGNGMTYIQNISYNKFGQRESIIYGNGTYNTYSYDLLQRLTGLRSFTANNEMMQDIAYNFDPVGNIMDVYNDATALQNGLGGKYDCHYKYDDLYRLIDSYGNGENGLHYGMTMNYTPNGKIKDKHVGGRGELNGGAIPIAMGYEYSYSAGSNRLKEVYDHASSYRRYFTWDGNGNMLLNDKGYTQQRHCWDEENRLMLMRSGREAAHYLYDASGERVYKVTGYNHRMNINGRNQDDHAALYDPTLYASPYVVASPKGYTKHYYAGAERIVSRIGGGGLEQLREPIGEYENKLNEIWERIGEGWIPDCFCYKGNEWEELMRQLEGADMGILDEYGLFTSCEENKYRVYFKTELFRLYEFQGIFHEEPDIYWYHPDHLGSSSWITDQTGEAIQHLQYLPFGEQYVDQRRTGWDAMFTFSGKERDAETGYGYFGARYYDSDLSIWLSVDPLAGKYPSLSPYVYCANNPIIIIDPDGRSTWVTENADGTYSVFGGDLNDKDKNIYVYRDGKRAESIGTTTSSTTFYNDTKDESGNTYGWMGTINPNDKSGENFLNEMFNNTPTMDNYMKNAGGGEAYDFKVTNGTGEKYSSEQDFYRGMPISSKNGKPIYSSARDIGNIAAGYVAAVNGMTWKASRIAFDGFQSLKQGIGVEGASTRNAQYLGWSLGYNTTTPQNQLQNLWNSAKSALKSKFSR